MPRVPLPWKRGLPRYANLETALPKLPSLLRDFAFGPLRLLTGAWKP